MTMKRFTAFMMALGALLFVACDTANTPTPNSKLTRTSAAIMEFDAAGGEGEITYTLENPANGVQVIARSEAEWVDNLTTGEKITFTVLPNTSNESRLATIAVTYGDDCCFEVTISQKGGNGTSGGGNNGEVDKELQISFFYGSYMGLYYGTPTYNYYVILSDKDADEEGYFPADAVIYYFDLYSNVEGSSNNFVLPNGTYTFDSNNTYDHNTISSEYSYYSVSDEEGYGFSNATLTVSNNKLVALVEVNGEVHKLVYEGSLVCFDDQESEDDGGGDDGGNDDGDDGGDYYAYSNLTSDYSFNISDSSAYGYADYYGDYYGIGCNNYFLDLYEDFENGNGLNIFIDLLTTSTSTDIVGTYTPYYTSQSNEYTFVEGDVSEEDYSLLGSWIATIENGEIVDGPLAPITLGEVKIAKTSQADVYAITLDCIDDAGYNIKGTFTCELEFGDYSGEYAAPQKAQKKVTHITKKAVKKENKKLRLARR